MLRLAQMSGQVSQIERQNLFNFEASQRRVVDSGWASEVGDAGRDRGQMLFHGQRAGESGGQDGRVGLEQKTIDSMRDGSRLVRSPSPDHGSGGDSIDG